MKAHEFTAILKKIASDYKTLYVYGSIGAHLTSDNIERYLNKYAYNRQAHRLRRIEESLDRGIFGFDCVCLVKAVLWGWNGDLNANYGGAVYGSNSVPDVGANKMIGLCPDASEDFSHIVPGELLWTDDHCGVYVGDGLVVECTPLWNDGVQLTALGNLPDPPGAYHQRKWKKHGRLPFVDYEEEASPPKPDTESPDAPAKEKPSLLDILRRFLDLILSLFGK